MASNNFRTFTITQARIGEPLQFQPALGSKELDELVDAYILGSGPKQDKLSEVTLEFFNLAQVDIYTGLLTRHYNVSVSPTWTHLASPHESQSSGCSPSIFTPSPASSMTFADSGYASLSMTPPTWNMAAASRVAKKAKKVTKKSAEVRLPGFSIMTKDGVDVTSSAGRGTKTKEQREHAHLMRIMKACGDCKRKKIRCDPSHRKPATDMSRSSTTSSGSSRPKTSPPVSVPSLSRTTTRPSPVPSFGNDSIDDFVLFPEDNAASWNPADLSMPEFDENLDLSLFNFDISGLNDFNPTFDFFDQPDFHDQPVTSFQTDRSAAPGSMSYHDPFVVDQYGLDHWASAQGGDTVSHTRPHESFSSQDSGQLDSSFFDGGLHSSTESPTSQTTPSSQVSSFAESFYSNGTVAYQRNAHSASISLPSAEVDWNLLEHGILAPAGADSLSAGSESLNRRERRTVARLERARNLAIKQLLDSMPSNTESISQQTTQSPSASLLTAEADWSLLERGIMALSDVECLSAGSDALSRLERRNIPRLERARSAAITEISPVAEYANALAREDAVSSTPFGGDAQNVSTAVVAASRQAHLQDFAGVLQTRAGNSLIVNPQLEASPHILADQSYQLTTQRTSSTPALSVRSFRKSGSVSPQHSGSSSSGSISGTALDNAASHASGITRPAIALDIITCCILVLASLVLMNVRYSPFVSTCFQAIAAQHHFVPLYLDNGTDMFLQYLEASAFLLPLAATLLAIPHPTSTTVTMPTLAVAVASLLPLSVLLSSFKYIAAAGILSAPLFKQSSKRPFERSLSVRPPFDNNNIAAPIPPRPSPRLGMVEVSGTMTEHQLTFLQSFKSLSSPLGSSKDSSILSMFRGLRPGHHLIST
ncbi:hypothetical protein D0Z07_2956 [Hyphodiscus hymeniophilus]|uniref:Uncharacterized protein n=1 Tax=Hyphodiscus hymeniophilus TaxID=353542 RepID=A0A9P6VL64_9HELO|nr:hypothetical protein D0Z07_2956 [Hyphodiscus hymeniophilus]